MNAAEARAVLRTLQAAFPRPAMGRETVDLWINHLADIDPDDGLDAAGLLAEAADRMPSLAELRKTAIGLGKRQRELDASHAPLPAEERAVTSAEIARDAFAEMRRILQDRKAPVRQDAAEFVPGPAP